MTDKNTTTVSGLGDIAAKLIEKAYLGEAIHGNTQRGGGTEPCREPCRVSIPGGWVDARKLSGAAYDTGTKQVSILVPGGPLWINMAEDSEGAELVERLRSANEACSAGTDVGGEHG